MNIKKIQSNLNQFFKEKGLKTTVSIAAATGVSQPSVYRALNTPQVSMTRTLKRLCDYSEIDYEGYKYNDPSESEIIMRTIGMIWDGTQQHAIQLCKLIKSARTI